ncbi:MAG: carbohydrate kinase [Kiritimatiellae bacterium]|jgi:D-beta-D-heptose 7-phosphate kinase/D-beta-D-heptose 1-phosphate adenosyltransferase|nr:carbohydrate kinase [Kiritimatiellia bacterium]
MNITRKRVLALLGQFGRCRILVVGDLMLDRFVYGHVTRISPEAPVPVVRVSRETSMPGGASNVACNIRTLGAGASIAGLLGKDREGVELRWLLQHAEVDVECALMFAGARTIVKERIIAEQQQVVRVDFEKPAEWTKKQQEKFLVMLALELEKADGVIIEDYGKGAVTQPVVDLIMEKAAARGLPVGLDPKEGHDLDMKGITVATPNRKEALAIAGLPDPGVRDNPLCDKVLLRAGDILMEKWAAKNLAITLGPQGVLLLSRGKAPQHVQTRAREVYDVSGAGDTVIAACVSALAAGASFAEAVQLANIAAGVVVGKLGTASCTPEELVASMRPR